MPSPAGGTNPDHYIYVSNKFQVKPGAKITDDLFVGPGLGVGLQVQHYPVRLHQVLRLCAQAQRTLPGCVGYDTSGDGAQCTAVHETGQVICREVCFCCKMHRGAQTPTRC